jgi:MOSC domain-containing protein YiiM
VSTIVAVFVGKAQPFGPKGVPSAIAKQAVASAYVSPAGVEGDEHGDPLRHGGPDKAVHHYPREHYDYWRSAGVTSALLDVPGSFGENVTTVGMTEANVCVGDVYRTGPGGPVLRVTQSRQPCWKLGERFTFPKLAADAQRASRTGWHYGVVENGVLRTGNAFELIERPHPDWPLARLLDVLYLHPDDRAQLAEAAELRYLAPKLRDLARHRLETSSVESWETRLSGSP